MLDKQDQDTLEKIVELEGNCLRDDMCRKCPFRSMCLPEFLNIEPPTRRQRMNMALNVLVHNVLVGPGIEDGTYEERKLWSSIK